MNETNHKENSQKNEMSMIENNARFQRSFINYCVKKVLNFNLNEKNEGLFLWELFVIILLNVEN